MMAARSNIYLFFIVLVIFVLLATMAAALDVNKFPYVSRIQLQNFIIVYLNQDVDFDDLSLRTYFLGWKDEHQGLSTHELFDKVCPDRQAVIIAVFLDCYSLQRIFFYIERGEDVDGGEGQ